MYTHTHTHMNIFSHRNKEILLFAKTWMDLDGIMLSEIKTDTVQSHLKSNHHAVYNLNLHSDVKKPGPR